MLADIRYVRLGTRNLDAASRFVCDVVGLDPAGREPGARYFASDARDYTLVYVEGDPREHATGFDVADRDALQAAAASLDRADVPVAAGTRNECDQRRIDAFVHFRDPTGNRIELAVGPRPKGDERTSVRERGITGFSHIGLRSNDPARDEKFWTGNLSARVSDRIGTSPLLRIDEVHHRIALFPSTYAGVQHVNHQVASIDDVMRAWYRLRAANVRIVFGPGRHPTSGAVFLYFEGHDGMVYEYSTGVRRIGADEEATHAPRDFPMAPESFCMWGSRPDIPEFRR